MATAEKPSMNDANDRDPHNNNSYGTLVDKGYKEVELPVLDIPSCGATPVLDVTDFNDRIIRGYAQPNFPLTISATLS